MFSNQLEAAGALARETLPLINPKAMFTDYLEYYYETAVTGRSWLGSIDQLKIVLEKTG
jgi:hypothetical protein